MGEKTEDWQWITTNGDGTGVEFHRSEKDARKKGYIHATHGRWTVLYKPVAYCAPEPKWSDRRKRVMTTTMTTTTMDEELMAELLASVETVRQRCFVPVPAEPLMALNAAVEAINDALEQPGVNMRPDIRGALEDVLTAVEDLLLYQTSSYPDYEIATAEMLVDMRAIYVVLQTVNALLETVERH